MPAGSTDQDYTRAFKDRIIPKIQAFKPEFIIISAGFDAHRDDPLAGICLSTEFFGWMTRRMMEMTDRFCQGRMISILEGGYNLNMLPIEEEGKEPKTNFDPRMKQNMQPMQYQQGTVSLPQSTKNKPNALKSITKPSSYYSEGSLNSVSPGMGTYAPLSTLNGGSLSTTHGAHTSSGGAGKANLRILTETALGQPLKTETTSSGVNGNTPLDAYLSKLNSGELKRGENSAPVLPKFEEGKKQEKGRKENAAISANPFSMSPLNSALSINTGKKNLGASLYSASSTKNSEKGEEIGSGYFPYSTKNSAPGLGGSNANEPISILSLLGSQNYVPLTLPICRISSRSTTTRRLVRSA